MIRAAHQTELTGHPERRGRPGPVAGPASTRTVRPERRSTTSDRHSASPSRDSCSSFPPSLPKDRRKIASNLSAGLLVDLAVARNDDHSSAKQPLLVPTALIGQPPRQAVRPCGRGDLPY